MLPILILGFQFFSKFVVHKTPLCSKFSLDHTAPPTQYSSTSTPRHMSVGSDTPQVHPAKLGGGADYSASFRVSLGSPDWMPLIKSSTEALITALRGHVGLRCSDDSASYRRSLRARDETSSRVWCEALITEPPFGQTVKR